jgi:hypothetical protein
MEALMSQHYFNTQRAGTPVTVLLGWDRPIGHFFMVVECLAASTGATESASSASQVEDDGDGADDDGYLYSYMNEPNPFGLSLDRLRGALSDLGIQVPEEMFEQVLLDQAKCVGNRHVWYEPDGSFKEV